MIKTTEQNSNYDNLEKKSTLALLLFMNEEDTRVPLVVKRSIPQIEKLVDKIDMNLRQGGRVFYIGAGTSGRLGVLDASEIPPTFGLPEGVFVGLIAGGDTALRKAVEACEDDKDQAWQDLDIYQPNTKDIIIGIAASGSTPYVIGALQKAQRKGLFTACITCNAETELARYADIPIEIIVGPEFITGSTRLKAGTATKMTLNMITTCVMIKIGRVKGNKMVNMQLNNQKLIKRGIQMIIDELKVDKATAERLLHLYGSVRKVLDNYTTD